MESIVKEDLKVRVKQLYQTSFVRDFNVVS